MKKGVWVSIFAAAAAVAAAAVAVTAFIKRKSEALADHLDYDPDAYFESDEEDDASLYEGEPVEVPADEEEPDEETIPPLPDEQSAVEEDDSVSEDDQAY